MRRSAGSHAAAVRRAGLRESRRALYRRACRILGEEGRFLTLIKPQFEAGRERVGKKGVVSDPQTHFDVVKSIVDFAPTLGWRAQALDYSPIRGPEGNIEFLADLVPEARAQAESPTDDAIRDLVARAHAGAVAHL